MLNESLFSISIDELKNIISHDWTIFSVAQAYVLGYVVYKVLGRYIYFKPQEHASKINRTFLSLALAVVTLHFFDQAVNFLPFSPEYRWLYGICTLSLFVALLSILMYKVIWIHNKNGPEYLRYREYLPIQSDYHKTTVDKTETNGNWTNSWQDEAVTSTQKNLHSDALLNIIAIIAFNIINFKWALESAYNYGVYSLLFSGVVSVWISGIFFDCGVFSWIRYVQSKKR